MCQTFLKGLGIQNLSDIQPIKITADYIDSFEREYIHEGGTFVESLASLAVRELVAPERTVLS